MVNQINHTILSDQKIISSTEEKPSVENYYDGSQNLNLIVLECERIHLANDCYLRNDCGWCDGYKKCVPGSENGPVKECPRDCKREEMIMKIKELKDFILISSPQPHEHSHFKTFSSSVGLKNTIIHSSLFLFR